MRTSFHHQSEAQSPNGPLTAATSPDTPSPSPTTHSHANRDFPRFDEHPAVLRGRRAGLQSLQVRTTTSEAFRGLLSLASKNRFPEAWQGAARDSVRMMAQPE